MSENKKSVFFSNKSLQILGLFSSGRLNAIIDRYHSLITNISIEHIFLENELDLLYKVSRETATKEKMDWQDLSVNNLVQKIDKFPNDFDNEKVILKLQKLDKLQELSLIEKLEKYWLDERVKLFNEYRLNKIKKPL
ncbi:MAG: hypothetical protein KDI39_07915 [Pseudomonadales bacterium]|nr:hypothetical protein [Pseudomonadales bacterium]